MNIGDYVRITGGLNAGRHGRVARVEGPFLGIAETVQIIDRQIVPFRGRDLVLGAEFGPGFAFGPGFVVNLTPETVWITRGTLLNVHRALVVLVEPREAQPREEPRPNPPPVVSAARAGLVNGHGHVTPNPDGSRARCGGPGLCEECSMEEARTRAAPVPAVYVGPGGAGGPFGAHASGGSGGRGGYAYGPTGSAFASGGEGGGGGSAPLALTAGAEPYAQVLAAVLAECLRQNRLKDEGKFDYTCADPELSQHECFAVLGEEFGEVARELNEGPTKNLIDELIQVAAVAVAWVVGEGRRDGR